MAWTAEDTVTDNDGKREPWEFTIWDLGYPSPLEAPEGAFKDRLEEWGWIQLSSTVLERSQCGQCIVRSPAPQNPRGD